MKKASASASSSSRPRRASGAWISPQPIASRPKNLPGPSKDSSTPTRSTNDAPRGVPQPAFSCFRPVLLLLRHLGLEGWLVVRREKQCGSGSPCLRAGESVHDEPAQGEHQFDKRRLQEARRGDTPIF